MSNKEIIDTLKSSLEDMIICYMKALENHDPRKMEDEKNDFLKQIENLLEAKDKELKEVLEALEDIYEQYCRDGHDFMSAGENAIEILEKYTDIKADNTGKIL